MADFSLWHDGVKWRFEVTTVHGRKRGWRPTQAWAKGAALRHVHDPMVPCPECGKDIDSVARQCQHCAAWVEPTLEPARRDRPMRARIRPERGTEAASGNGAKAATKSATSKAKATSSSGRTPRHAEEAPAEPLPKRRPPVVAEPGVSASFATAGAPLPPAMDPPPVLSPESANTVYRVVLGVLVGTILVTVVGLAMVVH